MFREAHLKMTALYVAILMVLSLLFSVWVYNEATRELRFGLNTRMSQTISVSSANGMRFVEERLQEGRQRVLLNLVFLNVIILVVGGAASYWLARRTMRPIEEAMEAQDRFTADASHELRTPLSAMKAEIEVALRDKKRTRKETDVLLHSTLEEVDRLGGLAEGLLTLAHRRENAPLEIVDFTILVKEAVSRFTPLAQQRKITLRFSPAQQAMVRTQPAEMKQAIGVLLDNAIKYSPNKATVTVQVRQRSDHIVLQVKDKGPGIKKIDIAHIFDRFYRADASRTQHGHGLGLAIAKKVVEASNGHIAVKSTPGKGATFTITLPLI